MASRVEAHRVPAAGREDVCGVAPGVEGLPAAVEEHGERIAAVTPFLADQVQTA